MIVCICVVWFRVNIVDGPSYVSVTHNSGLFKFPRCAITSFDYQYKGPWVNASSDQNKMGQDAATAAKRSRMEVSYPTICECNLTIKVLEHIYADASDCKDGGHSICRNG